MHKPTTLRLKDREHMTDQEFQAKAAHFQEQFMKLFHAHTALLTGATQESKKYREYIARLGAIQTNAAISNDDRDDLLIEEQEYSDMSYVAEDLAGSDQDLLENLLDAIGKHERIVALVNIANGAPRKPRARKARSTAGT